MNIKDKVVIVTGGAHGIGRALCRAFHAHGAKAVVIADLDLPASEKLATEIEGLAVQCNVAKEEQIQALVKHTQDKYGRVDIFVSNAGLGITDGPDWSAAGANNKGWQLCWDVNVMAAVYAARAVLPEMRERGSGYLLNTASAAGLLAQMGDAAYTATKHAAVAFAKNVAITHGHEGIGVSVLCPQYVATNIIGFADDSTEERRPGVLEAEDVAEECMTAIENEQFMIQPHKQLQSFQQAMVADYDAWISSMQNLRKAYIGDATELHMGLFTQTKV